MNSRRRSIVFVAAALVAITASTLPCFAADPSTTITVSGTIGGSPSTVKVNGITSNISGTTFTASSVPVKFGPNTVTAIATDSAGNSSSHSITVHVAAKITVQGTVNESTATVTVNGITASLNAGQYTAAVPLTLGLNTLTAVATDQASNSTTKTSEAYVVRNPINHP